MENSWSEGSSIGYIGYPRLLAPRHLARVMAVIVLQIVI